MLKSLSHHNVAVPIYFIHAARNSRVHAMAGEVRQLAAGHPNIHTHIRYDAPLPDDLPRKRCDSVGFIDEPLLRQLLPSNDAEFYFCGPRQFMAGLYRDLKQWGVDDAQLHYEFFGPRQDITSATRSASLRRPAQPHRAGVGMLA
jgi:nitric oxide dioxygenase